MATVGQDRILRCVCLPISLCMTMFTHNGYRIYNIAQGKQIRYYKASESDEGSILKVLPKCYILSCILIVPYCRSQWIHLACLWPPVARINHCIFMISTRENVSLNSMVIQVVTYTCIHMHIYLHAYIYIHPRRYTQMQTCTHTLTYTRTYAHMHTHSHTHACIHMHTHAHTNTHSTAKYFKHYCISEVVTGIKFSLDCKRLLSVSGDG